MNTNKMLTSKDMMALFGVSHMTIHHWRDRLALPIKQEKGSRNVYFDPTEVRRWAKDQGMKCTVEEVNQILAKRDGRKPTTKAKPAKPKAVGTLRGRLQAAVTKVQKQIDSERKAAGLKPKFGKAHIAATERRAISTEPKPPAVKRVRASMPQPQQPDTQVSA